MKHTHLTANTTPFLRSGLSQAIPTWILFRQSLHKDSWKSEAHSLFTQQPAASDATLVQHWLTGMGQNSAIPTYSRWTVIAIGLIVGCFTMIGGLSYSGSAPVNLWLLLGLYCFIPLLMTIATAYAWFTLANTTAKTDSIIPNRYAWAHRIYSPLLSALSPKGKQDLNQNLSNTDKYILQRWLMWKLQGAAMAFQLSAITTFVFVLLFKDIAFGWSSTIIQTDLWIPSLIENLALPWSWLIAAPSAEVIESSRFYRAQDSFDAAMLGQWWSYVVMAMIVYGFLPRFLLSYWMKTRIQQQLITEICSNGDIALFIRAARHVNMPPSETLANANNSNAPYLNKPFDITQYHLVAWQHEPKQIPTEATLGNESWDDDTAWIRTHASNWQRPLAIIVSLDQTPTAELADIILLIRESAAASKISILISTDNKIENVRELGQLNSWQVFAHKHKLTLYVLNSSTSDMPSDIGLPS